MLAPFRFVPFVCLAWGAMAPRAALADLPGGAKVTFSELLIRKSGSTAFINATEEEERNYFNRAHCFCSVSGAAPDEYTEAEFAWELRLTGRTQTVNVPAQIYTGIDCNNVTSRPSCEVVGSIASLDPLSSQPNRTPVRIHQAIQPKSTDTDRCGAVERKALVWVGADGDSMGDIEYWESKGVDVDTNPPPIPTGVSAKGGENGAIVTWTNPQERATDIEFYQFLCARRTETSREPALASPSHSAQFQRAASLCGLSSSISELTFTASEGSSEAPSWLADPERYICGQASAGATSYRVGGLANGSEYEIAMVAIDHAGNASGVFLTEAVTPESLTDFWEDLQDKDPQVEGGYCLIATAYGDDSGTASRLRALRDETLAGSAAGRWLIERYYSLSAKVTPLVASSWRRAAAAVLLLPVVALGLLWQLLTLPGLAALALALAAAWALRRRWRAALPRRHAVALAVLAALACWLAPGLAGAQSLGPYWEDELTKAEDEDPFASKWHVGLRAGPYTPAIDAQVPGRPYADMFGGDAVMPALDIDYVLWENLGQVAVGGSLAFMGKSANAFTEMDDPDTVERDRGDDKNRFRLIPLALTAAFRLTALDTRFGIPLVPYVRGGLAYYLWWVEAPNGDVASTCSTGGTSCNEKLARGGTLGVVGSIGLAVRAERIDSEAAAAMRDGGIQHAGFYAELQGGWVEDFGIGKKLSVGDVTWFAGVDFEF